MMFALRILSGSRAIAETRRYARDVSIFELQAAHIRNTKSGRLVAMLSRQRFSRQG